MASNSPAQHSPLPWTVYATLGGEGDHHIVAADGWTGPVSTIVCELYEPHRSANADFIMRACNSHDALLAALKAFRAKWDQALPAINGAFALQHLHGINYTGPIMADELKQIDAAIAKAEGR